ncbi:MAG: hypothetical protein A2046_12325 [Bacteroidetes bacterium GWA2_30_7]|nr:MAG: hypothetical protein A2046_12325 [Bacteroidetes bacterium GWA2_30_7]
MSTKKESPTTTNGQDLNNLQNKNTKKIPTYNDFLAGLIQKKLELIENENMIVSTFKTDTL